nr:peptidase M23 [Aquimixticola soesokkakensis]
MTLFCLAPVAQAQNGTAAVLARTAVEQFSQAIEGMKAADGSQDRVRALTETITAYENGLEAMREGLREASLRETAIAMAFNSESARVSELLAVLMNLPSGSPLSLLHPSGPVGTARAGMLVSEVTPAFQAQAEALRETLEEVQMLRSLQQDAARQLAEGLRVAQDARTELSQAISDRTDLPQRFAADGARVQRLISNAETLKGFAEGLTDIDEAEGVAPMAALSDQIGSLPLPVHGTLLRAYNEADAAGIRRPGWLVATRPLSLVTTPWPATIRYFGPFLDYGNVMILEPGNDILMVLAGMEDVYGEIGSVIPAGTPIGVMGGAALDPEAFLVAATLGTGDERTQTLYIEIRQGGDPVDPATWFAARGEETQ